MGEIPEGKKDMSFENVLGIAAIVVIILWLSFISIITYNPSSIGEIPNTDKKECLIDACEMACSAEGFNEGDYDRSVQYKAGWLGCKCLREGLAVPVVFGQGTIFSHACQDVKHIVPLK